MSGAETIDKAATIWCQPAGHNLEMSHKLRVLDEMEHGWVDDEIATAAMKLLKSEYPEIGGLRPTALFYGQTRVSSKERRDQLQWLRTLIFHPDFEHAKGRQAQILYTGSLHWVLVSNYHEHEEEVVYVYDSRDEIVPDFLIAKIAAVYRFRSPSFRVSWPPVDQQKNNKDCGIFAIAFLVALCNKQDPTKLSLDSSKKLREHLALCCEESTFAAHASFPTRPERNHGRQLLSAAVHRLWKNLTNFRRRILLPDRTVKIICRCRMPPGKGRKDRNVMCRNPSCDTKLFHGSCLLLLDRANFLESGWKNYMCSFCRTGVA